MIKVKSASLFQSVSANGQSKKTMNEKVQTIIASVLTAAIIGLFTFLWNLNKTLGRMEEREFNTTQSINDINNKINNIQLDVRDLRDKTIRIETITPNKK
jgi:outer membrane protein TolC